jgi:16S rRNA G966 N2-methylase RsmD
VLRTHIADESVDLIYLDPPFNSNASYNVLFTPRPPRNSRQEPVNTAQIEVFDDTDLGRQIFVTESALFAARSGNLAYRRA